jgi:hypothetical protein
MSKAERKRRAAIRSSRDALAKAYLAVNRFRKWFKYVGWIGKVDPSFPPPFPSVPCGPIRRLPGKPKRISQKQFDAGMREIEVRLLSAKKMFNRGVPPNGGGR